MSFYDETYYKIIIDIITDSVLTTHSRYYSYNRTWEQFNNLGPAVWRIKNRATAMSIASELTRDEIVKQLPFIEPSHKISLMVYKVICTENCIKSKDF